MSDRKESSFEEVKSLFDLLGVRYVESQREGVVIDASYCCDRCSGHDERIQLGTLRFVVSDYDFELTEFVEHACYDDLGYNEYPDAVVTGIRVRAADYFPDRTDS